MNDAQLLRGAQLLIERAVASGTEDQLFRHFARNIIHYRVSRGVATSLDVEVVADDLKRRLLHRGLKSSKVLPS